MKKRIFLAAGVCLVLLLAVLGYRTWYENNHIRIGGVVYEKDIEVLDLRGQAVSVAEYEALHAQLPDCEILWELPFQNRFLPLDTQALSVTQLTDDDITLLRYLPQLKTVDATGCGDYDHIFALQQAYPQLEITYQVTLGGAAYPQDTTALEFSQADGAELLHKLQYLPRLASVHFDQPQLPADDLLALRAAYPQIAFTWEKDILGVPYREDLQELDLSGTALDDVAELEASLAYFPALNKLILCNCGLDNETLAAYRDRVRDQYKVVWSVKIAFLTVRTDETTFMPTKYGCAVQDGYMKDFVYCEDMICVDVGHMSIKNIDWIYGMPHLQFLVLADTNVEDITPIGTLKELIYLELFKSPGVTDYSPLINCTALQDVNVAYTNGDATAFTQMPWLHNLWVNCCNVSPATKQLLRDSLPNTHLEMEAGWHMGNGWRDMDNYYVMRDLLQMPYYDWGSKRLANPH